MVLAVLPDDDGLGPVYFGSVVPPSLAGSATPSTVFSCCLSACQTTTRSTSSKKINGKQMGLKL